MRILLVLVLLFSFLPAAQAQAPTNGSCELYGCEYVHLPTYYTRTPQEPKYAVAYQTLPDGPEGRKFVRVMWPAGYDPSRRPMWDRLMECEAGHYGWYANTGNGYYGGLQFSLRSWQAVGGTGYPHQHPPAVQIKYAERLLDTAPYVRHWPHCGPRTGLRR